MSVEKISKNVLTVWVLYTLFWMVFQILRAIITKITFILFLKVLVGLAIVFDILIIICIFAVYLIDTEGRYTLKNAVNDSKNAIRGVAVVAILIVVFPLIVLAFMGIILLPCS